MGKSSKKLCLPKPAKQFKLTLDAAIHNDASSNEFADHEKAGGDDHAPYLAANMEDDYEGKPTTEELRTLRRVPINIPIVAYLICIVEFSERASYYGVQPLISNFVNRPMPTGGNGWVSGSRVQILMGVLLTGLLYRVHLQSALNKQLVPWAWVLKSRMRLDSLSVSLPSKFIFIIRLSYAK